MPIDSILKITRLPDLSMPRYVARHGRQRMERAAGALFDLLEIMDERRGDWVALRYLCRPDAPIQEERLRLFVRVHAPDPRPSSSEAFPGAHLLEEFYRWTDASPDEAGGPLLDGTPALFFVRRSEEIFDSGQPRRIHYAPIPFDRDPGDDDDASLLDGLFHSLTAPCAVDIIVRPAALPEELTDDLLREIEELDRAAAGFTAERTETGAVENLARSKNLIADRHRDFYRQFFDDVCTARLYEFTLRIASEDAREGALIARTLLRLRLCPDACAVVERASADPLYAPHRAALSRFEDYSETFALPNGTACASSHLASFGQSVFEGLQARMCRLARLSRLARVINGDWARHVLRLPTSDGARLKTIRLESESHGVSSGRADAVPAVTLASDAERGGMMNVPLAQLTKHLFFAGVPGGGKTSTILNILLRLWLDYGVPFLVLEPVKGEYRALLRASRTLARNIRLYTPGSERLSPCRHNPFEVPMGVTVEEHLSALQTCFTGAIAMSDGPLPALISEALEQTYRASGFRLSDMGARGSRWPVMRDLVRNVRVIMRRRGYVGEVRANIETAIDVRLSPLVHRSVGRIFSFQQSCPSVDDLLRCPTILEMQHLNVDQQNLLVLFLLTAIQERLTQLGPSKTLRHLIVIEEAHNLIGVDSAGAHSPGDAADPRGHASRFLVKLLAEVRALGEGILIVDQSPGAVAPEVIKNTATKIVHRTVHEEDRDALGASMLLGGSDQEELARLCPGEAFMYHEGLYRPRRVTVPFPQGGYHRPGDRELAAMLANAPWFVSGQEARLAHLKNSLDQLLAALKKALVASVKAIRSTGDTRQRALFQRRMVAAVKATRERLLEDCAVASLDRTLRHTVDQLECIYRDRIARLVSATIPFLEECDHAGRIQT